MGAVFDAAGRWVADGALWLLNGVGTLLDNTTSLDLGAGWFQAHETTMAALAAAVVLPMLCCAAIQAIVRQSPSMLVRTVLVNLPLALLLSGVAVELVRLGLAVTDVLCAQVMAGAGVDTHNLFEPFGTALAASSIDGLGVPAFIVFATGSLVAAVALVLWLELVVRAAAVAAATLFLPLALAALVWPAVSHWCRRLADTLAALVLSKLVVVAVLSLAASAMAGGLGLGAPNSGGFTSVITGVALLALASLAPFTLLRLVPAVEAGAVSHLEGARHRLVGAARQATQPGSVAMDALRASQARQAALALRQEDGRSTVGAASVAAASGGAASVGATASAGVASSGAVGATGIPVLRGTPPSAEWKEIVQGAASIGAGRSEGADER
jgi:hypothetical protein